MFSYKCFNNNNNVADKFAIGRDDADLDFGGKKIHNMKRVLSVLAGFIMGVV